MLKENILVKLNDITVEFSNLEKYYRDIYNNAIDIDDIEEAQKVLADSLIKIRKIKGLKSSIDNIIKEINDSNLLETNYNNLNKEIDNVTKVNLDEECEKKVTKDNDISEDINESDLEYTSKSPKSIKLFNKIYEIKYWNEVLVKVCEVMLLKEPYIVARFDKEDELNSDIRINFSYKESDIKFNKKRLSNGLWIETNRSANDIVRVSKKILELCGYDENILEINYK